MIKSIIRIAFRAAVWATANSGRLRLATSPEAVSYTHLDVYKRQVYASKDFNELLPMYNVVRSMSRAGTPTDNAAMEAINGWIKAELFMDFHVTGNASVEQEVDDYIVFFNEQRPAYSLSYLTPKQFREQFAPYHNC